MSIKIDIETYDTIRYDYDNSVTSKPH